MKTKLILFVILIPFITLGQTEGVILKNAIVHVGNGKVLNGATVVFRNGIIENVGTDIRVDESGFKVFDLKGKHLYPGLICLNTFMGLNEIDAVRSTRDYNETGQVNPNVRSLIAYNTDSKVVPTALFNGITLSQVVPQGGLISGQSSVIKTLGWNWEDAMFAADDGVHLNWPEISPWRDAAKEKEKVAKDFLALTEIFEQALQYSSTTNPEKRNIRLESMIGLFNGTKRLYIHLYSANAILESIRFFGKYPTIKIVLVGASEAWMVTGILKEHHIPVILDFTHKLPLHGYDPVDLSYKLPSLLMKEGILIAIGHGGSWESRNLVFNAGTAAAYGLSKEEALQCITLNAAMICGIGNSAGSIEVGKTANILVSKGDILDIKSNRIEKIFIGGEECNLVNQQELLYKKFMKKYGFSTE